MSQDVPVDTDPSVEVVLVWDEVGTQLRDGAVRLPAQSVAVLRAG